MTLPVRNAPYSQRQPHVPPLKRYNAARPVRAPRTVDFNILGKCNLQCAWCWGPDHKAREDLTVAQWKTIARNLRQLGTQKITFTGGEPLMKEGLGELLTFVHDELKMRTTLSTNGLLLRRLAKQVLPFVDDIGLPLDGHTQEINSLMRAGTPKHFDRVLEAIRHVQTDYPKIDLTVRSVLSKKNLSSVPLIGKTIMQFGIDPSKLRWKIYQVTPTGVRREETLAGDWVISSEVFAKVMEQIKEQNPNFPHLSVLTTDMHAGRYFHIYPDGRSHVFIDDKDGYPAPFPLGNIGTDFDKVIENLQSLNLSENEIR